MNYEELLQFGGTFYNDNNNNAGVEWYVEEKENQLIIRIPGTNSFRDWITNFIFFPMSYYYPDAKVHSGWYNEYIQSGINLKMKKIIKEGAYKKVTIMGHSKGCTTALFLTQYLSLTFKSDNVKIETFLLGSPKVGNLKFKRLLEKNENAFIHNIQVRGDIVCKMPPNLILLFLLPYFFLINKKFIFCFFWHIGHGKKIKIGKKSFITFKGHEFDNYRKLLIEEEKERKRKWINKK